MLKKFNAVLKSKKIKYFYYGIISLLLTTTLIAFLAYQFYLIPNVESYKQKIENFIENETGGEAEIKTLNVLWNITNPKFQIRNFSITDKDNNKTIKLNAIDFEISWLSLIKFEPVLNQIIVGDIDILVERTLDNKFKVAGIEIIESTNSNLSDWLLNQSEIRIINGKVTWRDHARDAEDLIISAINFTYTSPAYLSYLDRHKFNLNALLSQGTKERIYLNGFFDLDKISRLEEVNAKINLNISQAFLTSFTPWVDYPFDLKQGFGDLKLNMTLKKERIGEIKTVFYLENFVGNFNKDQNQHIRINELSGNAIFENHDQRKKIAATNLNLKTDKLNVKNSGFEIISKNDKAESFKLKLNQLKLTAIEPLIDQFPFFEDLKADIRGFKPDGEVSNLQISWIQEKEMILKGMLDGVGIFPYKNLPGFKNLSAKVDIKNDKGLIDLKSKNVALVFDEYLRAALNFDKLDGIIRLDNKELKLSDFIITNQDLSSSISGDVAYKDDRSWSTHVAINLTVPDIAKLKKYYPRMTDPDLLNWLDTSLLKGSLVDSKININSYGKNISDSPKHNIQFSGTLHDSLIEFATDYPKIENANINIDLQNNKLRLSSNHGVIANQNISSLEVFYDLLDEQSKITSNWKTNGDIGSLVSAINNSPLYEDTEDFTNQLIAKGTGVLDLKVIYPTENPENIDFRAKYNFVDASIENPRIGLPEVNKLNASLDIKPDFYEIKDGNGQIFGMPVNFNLSDVNEVTKIDAIGEIDESFFVKNLGISWSDKVEGSAVWFVKSNITENDSSLSIKSDLKGLSINGPEPFFKQKDDVRMFSIVKKPSKEKTTSLILQLENDIKGKMRFEDNQWSGQINIFSNEQFEKRNGVSIFANLKNIDADDFMSLFQFKSEDQKSFKIGKSKINFEKLTVYGFNFNRLETTIFPSNTGVKLSLYSNEIKGNLLWDLNDNLITGRFNKLSIVSENQLGKLNSDNNFPTSGKPISLDMKIDDVVYDEKSYGKFEINASNVTDQIWKIDSLVITNPHHVLLADGEWVASENSSVTKINFKWKVDDLEKAMDQVGYPNLVKKGNARFNGIANWEGSPFSFSSDQVSGNFSMDIDKGEILEAKPGIGRLFGLLTLQNLPKRLSLDFSDLFSKGFIFDSINAGVRVNSGILSSNNFKMVGPAAEVLMDGEVDIIEETQNLHVTVKPFVSDSLSLAALAGGPLAGAAAFIAQKVLKDPLNKVLTDEYQITGTWDEPIEVDKPKSEELSELVDEEIIKPSDSVLQKLNIFKDKDE